ncbi:MAG: hypothetical protein OEV92_07865 [Nitrospinota bacterium]|nr:hypothetical protein [Nitrospinota bacterium]
MAIKYITLSGTSPAKPAMKAPAWRVASGPLSIDAGQNPAILLRADDGSLGGLICVADTGYHYTGLAKEQLGQALEKFALRGFGPERIDCAIIGGADSAKWKISKLANITRSMSLNAREFDLNGLFYRRIYFDPSSGAAEVHKEQANPDHWSPAKARLSLEDSSRAFSEGQAGGVVANATRFFRDKNVLTALEELIVPEHLKKNPREPLHIWSSACSNGAETYSLAMYIHQLLADAKASTPFTVFGTDINPHLVDAAKAGIYQLIRSDLTRWRPYFEQFGQVDGPNVVFGQAIRQHVKFRVFDLKNRPRKYRFRMIVCANVFQYYSEEARRFFLQNFAAVCQRPGYIYVGHVSDDTIAGLGLSKNAKYKLLTVD